MIVHPSSEGNITSARLSAVSSRPHVSYFFNFFYFKVPKLSDSLQTSESQKVLPDVVGSKKQVSYKTEIIGGVPIVTQTQVNSDAAGLYRQTIVAVLNIVGMFMHNTCSPLPRQHEGGDGADRAEREAMQRSHSQLPYFLGRPAQEHTVIKSGYCVKQGAVVSPCCRAARARGTDNRSCTTDIRSSWHIKHVVAACILHLIMPALLLFIRC